MRLTYEGSKCRDSADADVDEDSTRVVITVRETVRATSCDAVAILYDVEVRLDAPLADRALVDGACQMSSTRNYGECGPTKSTVAGPILTTPPRTVIGTSAPRGMIGDRSRHQVVTVIPWGREGRSTA